jgi:hypothetical protein
VKSFAFHKAFSNEETGKKEVTKPLLSSVALSDCWLHRIVLSPL